MKAVASVGNSYFVIPAKAGIHLDPGFPLSHWRKPMDSSSAAGRPVLSLSKGWNDERGKSAQGTHS